MSTTADDSANDSAENAADDVGGLEAARRAAIERSGWGEPVHWRQPRNPCLWVYLLMVGYGLYYTVTSARAGAQIYAMPLGVAALIFAGYAIPFWWFTARIDRYSPQPASLRLAAFVFGGLAATWTIALHANSAVLGLYAKWFGQEFALKWGAGLTAPVFEELGKGAGVLLLLFIAPRVIRTAYDGFIVGAFVGLGFEIIEDILYALNSAPEGFGVDAVGNVINLAVLRLATGFTSHIAYASIFGAGLVYIVGTAAQRRMIGRGLALCATSMVLHGTWDSAAALSLGNKYAILALLTLFVVVALIAVITVFRMTVPDERAATRAVLAPEVASGVLTEEELDALSGDAKTRKAYRRAGHGRRERRRRAHRFEAGHDLAHALAHDHGTSTERVELARRELHRFSTSTA